MKSDTQAEIQTTGTTHACGHVEQEDNQPEDTNMGKKREVRDWPTPAEMEVMRMLQNETGGMYGLEIVEASNNAIKRGSVYVLVGRLEEKGFVKAQLPKADPTYPGLPRRIYKLTAEGMRVLAAAEEVGLAAGV